MKVELRITIDTPEPFDADEAYEIAANTLADRYGVESVSVEFWGIEPRRDDAK